MNTTRPATEVRLGRREPTADHAPLKRLSDAAVVLGLGALSAIALSAGREFTFSFDDWTVLLAHHDGNYLTPLNGHLIVVPILIYQTLLRLFGAGSYFPFIVVGVAMFVAIPASFFWLHRRDTSPFVVAFAALLLAWSHPSLVSLIYPFLMNFSIPLICLLWALRCIESDRLRDDIIAAGLVTIALGTSGVGVTVAFAVIADLVLQRRRVRRLALFVPPVMLWLLWYVSQDAPAQPSSFATKVVFAWNILTATFVGIAHGSVIGGALVGLACLSLVALSVARWHTFDRRAGVLTATIVVFVTSVAWGRAGDTRLGSPNAVWYRTVIFLLVAMVLVRCLRGIRVPPFLAGIGALIVIVTAVGLVNELDDWRSSARQTIYTEHRAYLSALEAMGDRANPNRASSLAPNLTDGQYLAMVDRFGPVVGHVPYSELGPRRGRKRADALMVTDEHVQVDVISGPKPSCQGGWRTTSAGAHRKHEPLQEITVKPGTLVHIVAGATEPTHVSVRRFALPSDGTRLKQMKAGSQAVIRFPKDHSPIVWNLEVSGPGATVSLCTHPDS